MFEVRLINPEEDPIYRRATLLFHDTSSEFPDGRWDIKIDKPLTRAKAIDVIRKILINFAKENEITWDDAKANGASITVDLPGTDSKTVWTI